MNHRITSTLRLLMSVVLLIGMFVQPQLHVFAAATNITTITIPSTPAGGAPLGYTAGEVITIRVTFTAAETVTGTPSILINVGGNLRKATYISGSGTANLDFTYTVVAGDVDANGISIPANTLALNNGSINNGIDAAQLTYTAVADQINDIIAASVAALDVTAPVLRSAIGSGSTITLFYDELGSGLRAAPLPPIADFTFSRNGGVGAQLTVTSVSINHTANTVTVGLNGLISLADTNMQVSYTANGTNDVQDVAGNKVTNFSSVFVANTMPSFDVKGNTLSFDNPVTLGLGDGRTAGNKVLFSNIITVDGQSIDAIVTTNALTAGTTLSGFDTFSGTATPALTGTPAALDALWFKLNTTIAAAGGDATITFDFIKGGSYNAANLTASKGEDVILQNVVINSYDLDGAGGGATNFQYQEFGGFATYTVANNSALTQTQLVGLTHFQTTTGGNITSSPGTDAGDQIRVMALYEAIHQFQIKTGAIATGGLAYYYLDFSKGANWFNPTLTYEIPTVNPKVTNDTTPDLTGTFVGAAFTSGIPSATVQAYTLRVIVNGKTYTAGEVAGERTTLGNGDIQLLDATTGLRGVFNPTTGIGTWTLTIPPADALPLGTYDVSVDVGYGTSLATINKHTLDDTTNELVINGTPPDTTAPTFISITRGNPLGQNITPAALAIQNYVDFTVTFSEAVTNVDLTDFQITGAGSTGSNISSVTQTGPTTYTVRVSNIPTTNSGILDLNLLATTDIVDLAGNLLSETIDPVEGVSPTSGIDETYDIVQNADLVVTKNDSVASVNAGGITTYTVRVTNNGPSSVTGAILSDPTATGISKTAVVCSAAPGQCLTAPTIAELEGGAFALPALASGQFYEIQITATVTATGGTVSNVVTVTPPGGVTDPTPANNTNITDTDTVNPAADLVVTKTDSSATYSPGTAIGYTVVVTNNGPSPATNATVADTIPANIIGATWTCATSTGASCTAAGTGNINDTVTIPSGGTVTYTVIGVVSDTATGNLSNAATVTVPAGTTDPIPGNNTATDTDTLAACTSGPFASWTFAGSNTNIATGAGSFTYDTVGLNAPVWNASQIAGDFPAISFTGAQNAGYTANSDYVDFAVPTNGRGGITLSLIDYRSATGPTSFVVYYSADGTTYNALPPGTVYAIANGAWTARTIDFSGVTALNNNSNTRFRLYAYGASGGAGTWRFDNVSFSGNCLADLVISKTDSTASLTAGTSTTYTIRATNNGLSSVAGAILSDPLVAGLTKTAVVCSATPGQCTVPTTPSVAQLESGTFALPTLASGQFYEITVTANLTATSGTVANAASVAPPTGITNPGTSCVTGGGITRTFNATTGTCTSTDTNSVTPTITAVDDTATTPANTPLTTVVTTNDTNLGGTIDPNSVTITAQPAAGTGSVTCTAASCVYTPPAGYVGTTTYTYQVCLAAPNGAICDTAVVTVTVNPTINAVDDDFSASPISALGGTTASIIGNDTTNGVATLIGTNVTLTPGSAPTPVAGSLTMNADGTITVAAGTTPGTYTYPYTICTNPATTPATCDTANATVVVASATLNAVNDTATTPANTPVTTVVTTNDTSVGGTVNPGSVTVTAQPAAGTGSVVCTGASCVYTPPAGFVGTTTYTYQVCLSAPNASTCDTATVTVTVNPTINAVDDDYSASPINGGDGGTTASIITNDTTNGVAAVVGTNVTLTPGTAPTPTAGSITMNANGTITVAPGTTAGTYIYPYMICTLPATTPATCDTANATVVVTAPTITANDDTANTSATTPVTTIVTTNDTNVGGTIDPNSVIIIAQPPAGTGTVVCTGSSCVYTPPVGYVGTTTYTYQVCLAAPNGSICDTATVTVTVTPTINAVDNDYSASPINGGDGGTSASIIGNDTTNGVAAIIGTNVTLTPGSAPTPAAGSLTMNADGTITVAVGTTSGTYTYPYTICTIPATTPATCDTANATVVVTAPTITANDDTATTPANTPVTTVVTTNDTNVGGSIDTSSVIITAQPAAGTGSVVCTGASCVFTPPAGFVGTATYTYQVCLAVPNGSVCDTALVTVTINPTIDAVNDNYSASPILGSAGGTTASIIVNDITNGVAAVIGTNVTLTPGTAPTTAAGSISMDATGTITVAAGTTAGTYTYPYTICTLPATTPATCDTATATVVVTAQAIDAINDNYSGTPISGAAGGNAGNAFMNDTLNGVVVLPVQITATIITPASNAGVTLNTTTGSVDVAAATPAGTYTIVYQICENINPTNCDTATVTVVVSAPASISGVVFHDANLDGSKAGGEAGLASVTVELYDNTGATLLATTTTVAGGTYSFPGLTPGSYRVVETDPAGYVSSTANSVTVTIAAGGTGTANFGDYQLPNTALSNISGVVFDDANGNGIQEGGELPLNVVTVELRNNLGTVIGTTTTNALGSYSFTGLSAGTYTVVETDLPGYVSTTLNIVGVNLSTGTNATVHFGDQVNAAFIADPAVTKFGTPTNAVAGDTVVYTITVGNNGNTNANNVVLTDTKPVFLDIISITISPNPGLTPVIAGNTFTINFGTVTPTDFYTVTVLTRVNALGVPPGGANTVRLATSAGTDRTSNNTSAAGLAISAVNPGPSSTALPATGFAPNVKTDVAPQPQDLKYAATDVILEIPSLGLKLPIVGVPKKNGMWDVTWLEDQAGWLEGTAFPSWEGNSVLTGHVYLSNGLPGPFVNLGRLKYGDKLIVHAYGQKYTFEVRTNTVIDPNDASVLKHEEKTWLTLVTCKEYDAKTNSYKKRTAVRAVLVKVNTE